MAAKPQFTASNAKIVTDPRDTTLPVDTGAEKVTDDYSELCSWVIAKTDEWRDYRKTNYDLDFEQYERQWRAIWSQVDSTRKSERSKIMSPALSEAVENIVAEVEEAIFGRGDFFDFSPEGRDKGQNAEAVETNKNNLKEDLQQTDYVPNVGEALINGAVYGTGIGEILLTKHKLRDIVAETGPDGLPMMKVIETEVECATMQSVNPKNFLIDPVARTIDGGLGCAVEEYVAAHTIREGQEANEYRRVAVGTMQGDQDLQADTQTKNEATADKVHVIRYYGKVPEHLLYPEAITEKLFEDDDPKSTEPGSTKMIEAIVVIANKNIVLKAESSPYLMQDRPMVAFPWDIVPGRFWGRGVCEKGGQIARLLDAELRSRADALAYTSAPMVGIDGTRLPKNFKFDVYPGRNFVLNGDPSAVIKTFQFGTLEQNTWQQAQNLDQMVQRATGSLDVMTMARNSAGDARPGAVSMLLSGIVKRHKRTLMGFIDRFFIPSLRKIMWRNMQFYVPRYIPINFTFKASNTMGIMQREYETQQLTSLLQTMDPASKEYKLMLMGIIANTGLAERAAIIKGIKAAMEQADQMQQQQMALAAQQNQQPPVDPQLQGLMAQISVQKALLELEELKAKLSKMKADTQLVGAKTQTELVQPMIQTREVAMKGIYNTPQEQMQQEYDNRLKEADLMLKAEDIRSNERIAQMQTNASVEAAHTSATAGMISQLAAAKAPAPAPVSPTSINDVAVADANAKGEAAKAVSSLAKAHATVNAPVVE